MPRWGTIGMDCGCRPHAAFAVRQGGQHAYQGLVPPALAQERNRHGGIGRDRDTSCAVFR